MQGIIQICVLVKTDVKKTTIAAEIWFCSFRVIGSQVVPGGVKTQIICLQRTFQ